MFRIVGFLWVLFMFKCSNIGRTKCDNGREENNAHKLWNSSNLSIFFEAILFFISSSLCSTFFLRFYRISFRLSFFSLLSISLSTLIRVQCSRLIFSARTAYRITPTINKSSTKHTIKYHRSGLSESLCSTRNALGSRKKTKVKKGKEQSSSVDVAMLDAQAEKLQKSFHFKRHFLPFSNTSKIAAAG